MKYCRFLTMYIGRTQLSTRAMIIVMYGLIVIIIDLIGVNNNYYCY